MTTDRLPKATHGSSHSPLKIGDIEIPCYVLDDGRRVLTQRGLLGGLEMARGGRDGDRLGSFIANRSISPYVSSGLLTATGSPVKFRAPGRGPVAFGYEATILADLCEAVLAARRAGALAEHQLHIADRCEVLMAGFARVGIIALVDEATGYQVDRKRDELQKILAAYIAPELLPWSKRFPDEFYEQMFRLLGWAWDPASAAKPGVVGHLTNLVVYERLPDGVLDELRRREPTIEPGRRRYKLHQHLSPDVGQVHLNNHLMAVIPMMRGSKSWKGFVHIVVGAWPKPNDQLALFNLDDWKPDPR